MTDQKKPTYDVFLSHNSADKPLVETVGRQLREAGFNPYLDKWHLIPGQSWPKELAAALDACACVSVFFGPSGEGPWHNEEMQLAILNAVRSRDDYRVIPVLLPGSDESQIEGFLQLRTWVDFRPGLDDKLAFQCLVSAIKGVAPDPDSGLVELPDEPRPYRGIERFEGEQHQFFFGRDHEIRRLVQRLELDRCVAVVGASGSGKSSLARAGFFTDAAEEASPGIRNWRRIVLLPKNDPLMQLAANLTSHLPASNRPELINTFIDGFIDSPNGLTTALTTLFPNPDQPILLLVDQFEEIFTQRPPADKDQTEWRRRSSSFAANLLATVNRKLDWLRIVVTLRADFVDQFVGGGIPDYRTLLERRQFWLGPMDDDDLREAIVRPATKRGAFFEKGLVERILGEMHGEASALPLLEEALNSLWSLRRGPWLTHQAYDEIGGVGGALADKADRILTSLNPAEQAIARRVFLKLVQLGEGSRDTRRRVSLDSLKSVTDVPSAFQEVLDRFSTVGARLITLSTEKEIARDEERPSSTTAEVTHEALIDHWNRLSRWLVEARDDERLERRIEEDAKRWKAESEKPVGKPEGILWRPPDLDLARAHVKRIEGALPDLSFDFYQRSDQAENERVAKEEKRRQRELEQKTQLAEEQSQRASEQKSAATRFRWLASIATMIAVIAMAVGFYANEKRKDADVATQDAQEGQINAQVDAIALSLPASAGERMDQLAEDSIPDSLRAYALAKLQDELNKAVPTIALPDERRQLASGKANLAVALVKLGAVEKALPVLKGGKASEFHDPTLRSYLIHRFNQSGTDADLLASQLEKEKDAPILQALILSLGEYDEVALQNDRRAALVPKLLRFYKGNPDPGVRSASEWLLRRWAAQMDESRQVINELEMSTNQLKETEQQLRARKPDDVRRWYVNGQGHTMVIVKGPITFAMGAPFEGPYDHEEVPWDHEPHQVVEIPRSFAISTTEVTKAQFWRFLQDSAYRAKLRNMDDQEASFFDPSKHDPMMPAFNVSWFTMAAYCNWLTEQEMGKEVAQEQLCYIPSKDGKGMFEEGMRIHSAYADRTGYRLPTAPEWEFACRAYAKTRWSHGEAEDLLIMYAHYQDLTVPKPVGMLKPNGFGLFDMHGNVMEWCQDKYRQKYTSNPPASDLTVRNDSRVLRGGFYASEDPRFVSSWTRRAGTWGAGYGEPRNGFRVARTFK